MSLLLAVGVLLGGRIVEVVFYEWPFYRQHLHLIPAVWLGGMATHGLLFGGLAGVAVFCWLQGTSFLRMTDVLAIPAAFILGVGRVGNFIDGQIVGSVTEVWWAVKFPDAEGFRHPVVLYDGLKNLLIIPVLLLVGRRQPPDGVQSGVFLFLYGFVRIFIDVFREYPTTLLGLATGQILSLSMALLGLVLILAPLWRGRRRAEHAAAMVPIAEPRPESGRIGRIRLLYTFVVVFPLVIPSDWTQDVPARYGERHPGLTHSAIYPSLATSMSSAPEAQPQLLP